MASNGMQVRVLVGLVAYVLGASVGVISVILLLRRRGGSGLPRETIELIHQTLQTWSTQIAQGKQGHVLAGRSEIGAMRPVASLVPAPSSRSSADRSANQASAQTVNTEKSTANPTANNPTPQPIPGEKSSSGPQSTNPIALRIIMENRQLRTESEAEPASPRIQWMFDGSSDCFSDCSPVKE
jgi:hypothetical protein